jgi:mannose-6-phosphate isomerase-like protein (cupin superfamily)
MFRKQESKRGQFLWGMLAGAGVMAVVMSGTSVRAGSRSETVSQASGAAGSASKVVFENARVRVKDVTFPPGGGDQKMHTHDLAHVGVILTPGSLVFAEPGKPTETVKFDVGSVGFREAKVTHSATNPGQQPMRVIEVELK